MFEGIRRKLKGVIPYSRLSAEARTIFFALANDPAMQDYSCWRVVSEDPTKWFPNWFDYFDESLKQIAETKDRLSQALAIRKATVEHANASIQALKCFSEDFSEEDREILAHVISPGKDKQQFLEDQYQGYMVSDISTAVLRYLSKTFVNDAKQNDWYDLYSDAYNQLIFHTYSAMIADEKGDIYPMSPLIQVLSQTTEELKEGICKGENWEYDKQQIEAERTEEEKQQERAAEAKKRPKQKTVSNSQIEDLSEYLIERLERLTKGELYTVPSDDKGDKYYPVEPENALWADLGLTLISMSDCVQDRDTAVKALKKVAVKAYRKYVTDEHMPEIDMSIPEAFLDLWERNKEDAGMSRVVPAITRLLYGDVIDTDSLKTLAPDDNELRKKWETMIKDLENSSGELMGHIAVSIMDDALEVNHVTKKIFGWDVGEYSRIFSYAGEQKPNGS